jgi:hypothetical protein
MVAAADGTGFEFDTKFTQVQSWSQIGVALTDTQGFYSAGLTDSARAIGTGTTVIDATSDFDNIISGCSDNWTTGVDVLIRDVTDKFEVAALYTSNSVGGLELSELSNFRVIAGDGIPAADNTQLYITQPDFK